MWTKIRLRVERKLFPSDGAGYLYGLGFSPVASGGYSNYGFGYPYSRYGYGYGNSFFNGMGFGSMMGGNGALGSNFNDFTLRTSAFGLGYGFPMYG